MLRASNLWYLAEGMFGPLFAVFAERIGGDVLDISWAWAVYLIVAGFGLIVVGEISDRWFNKETLMLWGYVLNTILTFAYLLVEQPWHLFVVQAGLAIALALATPTWDALYAMYETKKDAGLLWGLSEGQASIMTGIALIIGGYVVELGSFEILFITMGCIQVISTLYAFKILRAK